MFEHLVGKLFSKCERSHAEDFHCSGKAINEKVRLYAKVGKALIEARTSGADAFAAIEAILSWSRFESTVAEAHTLAQPEEFDFLALLDERYSSVRKFAPLLLEHFEFHATPTATELLQALDDAARAQFHWQAHATREGTHGFRGSRVGSLMYLPPAEWIDISMRSAP